MRHMTTKCQCGLTSVDNLITRTFGAIWAPSAELLFDLCMTVLFVPASLCSGGLPSTGNTLTACCEARDGADIPGRTCWTFGAGLSNILFCIVCLMTFFGCPWNVTLVTGVCRGVIFCGEVVVKASDFLETSLFFTFGRTCEVTGGKICPLLFSDFTVCLSVSSWFSDALLACCCWVSLWRSSFFLAPACCCRRSSFCFRISSLNRFCSSIFKRYFLVSSSSSGNFKGKNRNAFLAH